MTQTTSANETQQEIMTTDQVAAYLQVPRATIYKWRHEETGPTARQIGKHLRFRRVDVDRWFDKQTP